jgi:hypothetical protein
VTAETYSNLRPHFMLRRYCLGGAGLPRDCGEGGVKAWYLSVCMPRLAGLNEAALFRRAIAGEWDVQEESDRVP